MLCSFCEENVEKIARFPGVEKSVVGCATLSFLSLIVWISLVNFKQGISLVIWVFSLFFPEF